VGFSRTKSTRTDLLAIFQAGLDAVAGETVVGKELMSGEYEKYSHFIAIGKAAESMLSGVPDQQINSALLISKHDHISEDFYHNDKVICIESDHPVPKSASINAGNSLITYLESLPETEPVLFLISGGTSALVEVLKEGWDLAQLQAVTDYLLANAYSIDEINSVRRRLSKIKGGGLWEYVGERSVTCLMISDVPDDDPAVIGSGLLFPAKENALPRLPEIWAKKLCEPKNVEMPNSFNWKIIASLAHAKEAAKIKAQALGYQVEIMPEFLESEAEITAKNCVACLQKKKNTLLIWGGETTVKLPENAGSGGRNQHLALAAAIAMQGSENTHLLSAGTDGSDGMTTATGAVVDGLTIQNGTELGMKAEDYLLNADSNRFFKATDNLLITGVTGTNVMDLVIGISS